MKSINPNPSFCTPANQIQKNSRLSTAKKFLITVMLVFIASPIFAQAAFDKFDGQDDVTSIIVNKKMFDLMSKVKVDASDKETQQPSPLYYNDTIIWPDKVKINKWYVHNQTFLLDLKMLYYTFIPHSFDAEKFMQSNTISK